MSVIEIVLLLFPGMIAADYYNRIMKEEWKWSSYLVNTATFALFINFIELSVIYLRGWREFSFEYITGGLMVKYMALGIVLSYVVPHIYKIGRYLLGKYFVGSIRE